ncbi:Peroxisomal membrane signal receptor PTS1 [Geranomyces michiganensis]|nr:Peroxisomal membrane signal receptor PTS1 [Geranomyces michiganensis]
MAFKSLVGSSAECAGGNSVSSFVKQLDRNHGLQQDLLRSQDGGGNSADANTFISRRGRLAELDDRGFVDEFLEARPAAGGLFEGPPIQAQHHHGLGRLEEVLNRQGLPPGMSGLAKAWAGDFDDFRFAAPPGASAEAGGSAQFEAAFRLATEPQTHNWSHEFFDDGAVSTAGGGAGGPELVLNGPSTTVAAAGQFAPDERQAFERAFAEHHRDVDLDQAFAREFTLLQTETLDIGKGKAAAGVAASTAALQEHLAWEEEFAKTFHTDADMDKLGDLFKQFDIDAATNSVARDWEDDYANFDGEIVDDEPLGPADPVTSPCAPYAFETDNPYLSHPEPLAEGQRLLNDPAGGHLSSAALAFEAAVQRDPESSLAWQLLGATQAENEKEGPAIAALQRSVQIDPQNLEGLMALAVSLTNENQEREAYATLERWVTTQYPDIVATTSAPPVSANATAEALHSRAAALFLAAARAGPTHARAQPVAGDIDPSVQTGLGVLFYNSCDFDKAIDCFSAAISASPNDYLLWNRLGATLANSGGRSEEAIDAYHRALELKPHFVRARYNLGVSCINIGCHREAAEHLLGALSMHRDGEEKGSANLWETLKRAFIMMDRRDLSDKAYLGQDLSVFREEFEF